MTPAEALARLREIHAQATPPAWRPGLVSDAIVAGPEGRDDPDAEFYGGHLVSESSAVVNRDAVIVEHNTFAALLDVAEAALAIHPACEREHRDSPSEFRCAGLGRELYALDTALRCLATGTTEGR